jgi:GntR family transcriptional regulator / MocR family aminotransferase
MPPFGCRSGRRSNGGLIQSSKSGPSHCLIDRARRPERPKPEKGVPGLCKVFVQGSSYAAAVDTLPCSMEKRSSVFTPVITIDGRSAQPLRSQIIQALKNSILRGDLRPGQRVPSSRALSAELNVSRITVIDSYSQLQAEGYFETRTGVGTSVSTSLPEQLMQCERPRKTQKMSGLRPIARRISLTSPEPVLSWAAGLGAFAVHQPAFDQFPFAIWSQLVTRHAKNPNAHAIHCLDPMGAWRFREAICDYLRTSRAVHADPEQIMIVSGSQQALQIAATVLLDPGDAVWMEEPGYRLARTAFAAAGCRVVPVPVDGEGLEVSTGIKQCADARAAYVTPSHQYPLGSTMSPARRLQLLNWAQSHGAWIIEDDYDSEYRFDSPPISSLQGMESNSRVIYIGTFSKVLFASLRLGYMVIPPDLVKHFATVRHSMDIFPPYLYQEVITDFMRAGHFGRHIRRMRLLYSDRRKMLVKHLEDTFGDSLKIHGAQAGMHLTATFRTNRDDVAIAERAAEQRLWLWPLSRSYMTKNVRKGFILGYGNVPAQRMTSAVEKLRSILSSLDLT